MKVTFEVLSITYTRAQAPETEIFFRMGEVGRGDTRMGSTGTLRLVGCSPIDLSPGMKVVMEISELKAQAGIPLVDGRMGSAAS